MLENINEIQDPFFIVFSFIMALCIGSFLNVVIYRVAKGESPIGGRSYCPKCNNELKWYHNIPLFSWLFLKGKCGFCKEPISKQYPIIEFITGILGVLSYLNAGFTIHGLMVFLTFSTLICISMIDFKYKMVPDSLSILALGFAILHSSNIIESIQFGLLMIGFFATLRITGEFVFRKEIMGEGDLMIAGIIGAMLPSFQESMSSIFVTAIITLIPSLYFRFKSKNAEAQIDSRFLELEKLSLSLKENDKEDVVFQEKMKILSDGLENMKYISKGDTGLPFIPFLTIGLFLTYFFNINFY